MSFRRIAELDEAQAVPLYTTVDDEDSDDEDEDEHDLKVCLCFYCLIGIAFSIFLIAISIHEHSTQKGSNVNSTGDFATNSSPADGEKRRLNQDFHDHVTRNESHYGWNYNKSAAFTMSTSVWPSTTAPIRRQRVHQPTTTYNICKESRAPVVLESLLLPEGLAVTFQCNICIKPGKNKLIEWKRKLLIQKGLQTVEPDGDKVTLLSDTALHIRDLTVDDTGSYICYEGDKQLFAYHLDVVKYEKTIAVMESGIKGRKPKPDVKLTDNNLHVFTLWAEWNRCNRCNKRGQRRRLGMCEVKKLDPKAPSKPEDVVVLNKYIHGMPCRSYLLPDAIKQLPAIKGRASEILHGYCWEPCPTVQAVKKITDSSGKVIEVVKSGQGIISMKESIPTFPPMVKRKTIYIDEGKRIKLECPTDEAYKSPVRWQNGTQVVNAATIKRTTRGRVNIDVTNRLVIRKLRQSDTAPYSCWISGRHVATIKIRVTVSVNRDLKDYVVFAGVGVTLLALVIICLQLTKLQNAKGRHGLK